MGVVGHGLVTLEEFLRMPGNERLELVRGEVIETEPPSREHGLIAFAIGKLLGIWAEQSALGRVGVESGFMLSQDPATLRSPDAYYVSAERDAADDKASAFWTIAPDLAVEVVSPSETIDGVRRKIRDYLDAGT